MVNHQKLWESFELGEFSYPQAKSWGWFGFRARRWSSGNKLVNFARASGAHCAKTRFPGGVVAAVTAYSLKRSVKMEIHIRQANDKVLVKDATHRQVPPNAETRRVFYNGRDHYSALVALQPGPQGLEPAWNQPPPVVYFKKVLVQDSFPSLNEAAALKTLKPKGFNKPRRAAGSKRSRKNGRKQEEAVQPMEVDEPMEVDGEGTGQEASQEPVKEDILAELGGIPVREGGYHPHRKTEILIKAGEVKAFLFDNLSRK